MFANFFNENMSNMKYWTFMGLCFVVLFIISGLVLGLGMGVFSLLGMIFGVI